MHNSINIQTTTDVHYHLQGNLQSDKVYLALHGVMEKGSKMLRRISDVLPKDALILAPDGPFPIPIKNENGYNVCYAWYFYDNIKNIYLIDYEYSANLLHNLLVELQLDKKDLIIIGYSQGGYLAPFVAQKCSQAKYIIGLACVLKEDLFASKLTIPFSLVHSKTDKMVSYEGSKKYFDMLVQ